MTPSCSAVVTHLTGIPAAITWTIRSGLAIMMMVTIYNDRGRATFKSSALLIAYFFVNFQFDKKTGLNGEQMAVQADFRIFEFPDDKKIRLNGE